MAPIPIKRVVSVSSEVRSDLVTPYLSLVVCVSTQDSLNPSSNLLRRGGGRKWLTKREDKGRRAEVVLELCKKTRINSVEIGEQMYLNTTTSRMTTLY